MNQDSFRDLLEVSRPSSSRSLALGAASTSRSRLVVQSKQKNTAIVVSKPAFKPRNIRKPDDGKDHDPKMPQDKGTNANNNVNVEHPPSKGLDFTLLEQERAKAGALSTNDVDELEKAFAESSALQDSEQPASRKRTREELIRELKQRRSANKGQPSELVKPDVQLEEAKQKGKFKPIGFTSTSKRRKDGANNADGKKKKRKVDNDKKDSDSQVEPLSSSMTVTSPTKTTPDQHIPTTDEHFDDNFDIFTDAGEYTGVEIDEYEETKIASRPTEVSSSLPQRWIVMEEPEHVPQTRHQLSSQLPIPIPEGSQPEADQEVEERPMRLAPLESSAVPSIKQLLDMHDAAYKYERKLKRKEKKQRKRGGNGKISDEEE